MGGNSGGGSVPTGVGRIHGSADTAGEDGGAQDPPTGCAPGEPGPAGEPSCLTSGWPACAPVAPPKPPDPPEPATPEPATPEITAPARGW
jgi:hypothetical protein